MLQGQLPKVGNHLETPIRRKGGRNGVGSDILESDSERRLEGAVDREGHTLVHHVAHKPHHVAFLPLDTERAATAVTLLACAHPVKAPAEGVVSDPRAGRLCTALEALRRPTELIVRHLGYA